MELEDVFPLPPSSADVPGFDLQTLSRAKDIWAIGRIFKPYFMAVNGLPGTISSADNISLAKFVIWGYPIIQ